MTDGREVLKGASGDSWNRMRFTRQSRPFSMSTSFCAEHGVFERETTLTAPVVATQQRYHFFYGVGLLHRHHGSTFPPYGIVEAHGEVAAALIEEAA